MTCSVTHVHTGGTFALYSLLKRAGDFRTFGKAHPADTKLERYSIVQGAQQSNTLNRRGQPDSVDWRLKLARNVTYQQVHLCSHKHSFIYGFWGSKLLCFPAIIAEVRLHHVMLDRSSKTCTLKQQQRQLKFSCRAPATSYLPSELVRHCFEVSRM